MQELHDGLILYHGSYCEVREPDLKTEKAIGSLTFVESEKVWIRK